MPFLSLHPHTVLVIKGKVQVCPCPCPYGTAVARVKGVVFCYAKSPPFSLTRKLRCGLRLQISSRHLWSQCPQAITLEVYCGLLPHNLLHPIPIIFFEKVSIVVILLYGLLSFFFGESYHLIKLSRIWRIRCLARMAFSKLWQVFWA